MNFQIGDIWFNRVHNSYCLFLRRYQTTDTEKWDVLNLFTSKQEQYYIFAGEDDYLKTWTKIA